MPMPVKVADRVSAAIKRFQPILTAAKARDVNESDTSIIVTDLLAEIFGYDKYSEITSEYAIRGTFCDLAIKQDGKIRFLIEVKPIGSDMKDSYVKQAVDYAANEGVEWVILTTASNWQVFRVSFGQPIGQDLVYQFDLLSLNHRNGEEIESLFMLTKEGAGKSLLDDYHIQRQAMSRFFLGAMIMSDPVLEVMRRELRRLSPGVKLQLDEIRSALSAEVLKREVVEGEKADEARRKISRSQSKSLRRAKDEAVAPPQVVKIAVPNPLPLPLPPPVPLAPQVQVAAPPPA